MNWLVKISRRFRSNDGVRYFTNGLRGKGKGIVLTPNFAKGTVIEYDPIAKKYRVKDIQTDELVDVHPRNLVHDSNRNFNKESPF